MFQEPPIVKVKTPFGELLSNNIEWMNLQYENGSHQRDITDLLLSDKYEYFLDIGASIGYYSIIASKHCKKVVAYECSPISFGLLLYNTKYLFNVECKYCFVANENAIPVIDDTVYSMFKGMDTMPNTKQYNIPLLDVKKEFGRKVFLNTLIKVDIEGFEKELLETTPKLWFETKSIDWYIDVHTTHVSKDYVKSFFPNRTIEEKPNEALFIR